MLNAGMCDSTLDTDIKIGTKTWGIFLFSPNRVNDVSEGFWDNKQVTTITTDDKCDRGNGVQWLRATKGAKEDGVLGGLSEKEPTMDRSGVGGASVLEREDSKLKVY